MMVFWIVVIYKVLNSLSVLENDRIRRELGKERGEERREERRGERERARECVYQEGLIILKFSTLWKNSYSACNN